MKSKLMLALPLLAVMCISTVLASECNFQTASIPKFSISADGGQLSNIGSFNSFTFSKASVDLWSNGEMQSLGSVMLTAENKITGKRVNLNLHLEPVALVCDDGIWSYEYLAHGTYWVKGTTPQQVYLWVDYSINTQTNTLTVTGEGIDGLNFMVTNMPIRSKI